MAFDSVPYETDLTAKDRARRLRKPSAGEGWMAAKDRRAALEAHEHREMLAARKRDLAACHGCRWPNCEFMAKQPRLEVSHCFKHRGMGGNPKGDLTEHGLLMLVCFIHHDLIDRGEAEVEALTERGTDDCCAFYKSNAVTGRMEHVATEKRIGVSTERSVR